MTNGKRVQAVVISGLVMAFAIVSPLNARNRHDYSTRTSDIITGAVVVGGVAAGIYALGSWLFGTTDEEVVDKARNTQHEAVKRYSKIIALIEQETVKKMEVREAFLESLAPEISATAGTVEHFKTHLLAMIDSLKEQKRELFKRAQKRNSNFMHDLVHELEAMIHKLSCVYDFVACHTPYFMLDDAERSLFSKYTQELAIISQCGSNMQELNHQLRGVVARYGADQRSAYPYLEYVERLKNHQCMLNECMSAVRHNYSELMSDARSLHAHLDLMVRELTADPAYMQSLRDRDRDRREQQERERLRMLERERIRLEYEAQRQRDIIIAQQREQARQRELERIRLERERQLLVLERDWYCRPQSQVYVEFEFSD